MMSAHGRDAGCSLPRLDHRGRMRKIANLISGPAGDGSSRDVIACRTWPAARFTNRSHASLIRSCGASISESVQRHRMRALSHSKLLNHRSRGKYRGSSPGTSLRSRVSSVSVASKIRVTALSRTNSSASCQRSAVVPQTTQSALTSRSHTRDRKPVRMLPATSGRLNSHRIMFLAVAVCASEQPLFRVKDLQQGRHRNRRF